MKKTIIASAAVAVALLATACNVPEENNTPGAQRATTHSKANGGKDGAKPKADAPKETVNQANARASAESYVEMSGFSRDGLVKQLKFEGFSKKDAIYGADAAGADWNAEAVESAKSYLDMSSFSRAGLIQQLEFEGFTQAQAEYGVKKTGLK
jgi:hypothetical protein